MREVERLGLILLLYDYDPISTRNIEVNEYREHHYPFEILHQPVEYLTRKGYFSKRTCQPTIKLFKLLDKYNVEIKQLKQWQDEYKATGRVTRYDKLGKIKL